MAASIFLGKQNVILAMLTLQNHWYKVSKLCTKSRGWFSRSFLETEPIKCVVFSHTTRFSIAQHRYVHSMSVENLGHYDLCICSELFKVLSNGTEFFCCKNYHIQDTRKLVAVSHIDILTVEKTLMNVDSAFWGPLPVKSGCLYFGTEFGTEF